MIGVHRWMSRRAGVLVQSGVLQVMGISALLLVGWMALANWRKLPQRPREEWSQRRQGKWTMQGKVATWLASCNAGRVTPSPGQLRNPRTSICQGSPQPPQEGFISCTRATLPPSFGGSGGWGWEWGGVIKQETVQTLGARLVHAHKADANKRTCILPTHCLPLLLATSLIQPVVPMEKRHFWAEGACSLPPTHSSAVSSTARSQVWVFNFFQISIF